MRGLGLGMGSRRKKRRVTTRMMLDAFGVLMSIDADGAPPAFTALDRYALPSRYMSSAISMSLILE